MKKILYVMDDINYRSGAHKAMLLQIKALKEHCQIHVFSLSRPLPKAAPPEVTVIGEATWDRTELFAKSFLDAMRSEGAPIREKAVRAIYSVLLRLGKAERFLEGILGKELKPCLERYDAVVVVSESSKLRRLVAKLEGPKKIQWIHTDYKLWSGFSEWTRHITKRDGEIYKDFDCIVALSERSREGMLEKLPGLRGKVVVIPNLIDGEEILAKANEKAGIRMDPGKRNLLTVGRMDREKGHGHILDLCIKLREKKIPFCWYLVGDGPLMKEIRERVEKEKLAEHVVLPGSLDNPYPLISSCDWLVLLSEYEGAPVTIDEAMVLGTRVAARDVGGVKEQLERTSGNALIEACKSAEKIMEILLEKKEKGERLDFRKQNSLAFQKIKMVLGI